MKDYILLYGTLLLILSLCLFWIWFPWMLAVAVIVSFLIMLALVSNVGFLARRMLKSESTEFSSNEFKVHLFENPELSSYLLRAPIYFGGKYYLFLSRGTIESLSAREIENWIQKLKSVNPRLPNAAAQIRYLFFCWLKREFSTEFLGDRFNQKVLKSPKDSTFLFVLRLLLPEDPEVRLRSAAAQYR